MSLLLRYCQKFPAIFVDMRFLEVPFTYRGYDPRIGRMWSVDPLSYKFPYYSPYHFASNSPIIAKDLEGLQSSVQLNYAEKSVTITRDESGRFFVTSEQLKSVPENFKRPATGTWRIMDLKPGGNGWDVYCKGCMTPWSKDGYMHLSIPEMKLMREIEVKSMNNVNSWVQGRIGSSISKDGKPINVADYPENDIQNSSNFLIQGINSGIDNLEEGAVLKSINVQVNFTLGEEYRSNIEKQLQSRYGDSVSINVNLDDSIDPKVATYGDVDYETTKIVTEEVAPVVITP